MIKDLHNCLSYNPTSGCITWKVSRGRVRAGDEAGCIWPTNRLTYRQIRVFNKLYYAHQLAWFLYHGYWAIELDHISGNGLDNSIKNLREVSHQANTRNTSRARINTSGYTGVCAYGDRFIAQLNVEGRHVHLGVFTTAEEAYTARKAADVLYGFHPNHGRN